MQVFKRARRGNSACRRCSVTKPDSSTATDSFINFLILADTPLRTPQLYIDYLWDSNNYYY